jgi:hypothetical protein
MWLTLPTSGPKLIPQLRPFALSRLRSRPRINELLIRREVRNSLVHLLCVFDVVMFVFYLANRAVPMNDVAKAEAASWREMICLKATSVGLAHLKYKRY